MRDAQRTKVYRWERAAIRDFDSKDKLPLAECQRIIDIVWADYRQDASPGVKDGRGTTWAWGGRWFINLPVWARTLPVVLHELAHAIVSGFGEQAHGPEYVRRFIELLVAYGGYDRQHLTRTAREHRVRIGTVAGCPQPIKRRSKVAPSERDQEQKEKRNMAGKTKEAVERKVQPLPSGFTGNIGKVLTRDALGHKQGEFLLVHAAHDGKTQCGNDTIGPVDFDRLAWKATTDAVTCGRCLKGEAKRNGAKPVQAKKVPATKKPPVKKAVAKKAAPKSAASRSQSDGRSKSAVASAAYRARKKAQAAG